MEIIEPTERERGEGIHIIRNEDPLIQKLKKETGRTWIQCGCTYGATCPNNPEKKLIGMFQCCHIEVMEI